MVGDLHNFAVIERPSVTERERRFAVAYFEVALEMGTDIGAAVPAYRRAFPQAAVDDAAASRLAQKLTTSQAVRELVTVLRSEYASRAAAPPEHIIAQLERVAFSNVLDFGRVDEDGGFQIDLSGVTHAQMAAVKEIRTVTRDMPGGMSITTTSLKFHSSLDALDKLAKIHGMYVDPTLNITASELGRVIENMRRRLGNAA